MDYTLPVGATSFSLNIIWDKILDREGKANILEVKTSGSSTDEIYVGGYTSRIDTSTVRDYMPTVS
jgi:hypothetical protein